MQLTKQQLKQIIKEELGSVMNEMSGVPDPYEWIVSQLTNQYETTSAYTQGMGGPNSDPLTTSHADQLNLGSGDIHSPGEDYVSTVKDELMYAAEEAGISPEAFEQAWPAALQAAKEG